MTIWNKPNLPLALVAGAILSMGAEVVLGFFVAGGDAEQEKAPPLKLSGCL